MKKVKKKICFGGEDNYINSYDRSKVVLLPVPYEKTTTYQKGTKNGPEAILNASEHMELYDEELDLEIFKIGVYTVPPLNLKTQKPESALRIIEKNIEDLLNDDKFPVLLGGEHTISFAAVSAFRKRYKNLTTIQLDAHADLRDRYLGSKFNHACTMARVVEKCPVVQIGIRSLSVEESLRIKGENKTFKKSPFMYPSRHRKKNCILFASDMKDHEWISKILTKINGPIYLTIDLDYFDPSIMPSVGTPEPGGGLWYVTIQFLKLLSKKANIVGFDLVELCPQKGNPSSDFLAAKLIYKLLGYIFSQ